MRWPCKAPGRNGPSVVEAVIARIEALAPITGDSYWRSHVVIQAVGPTARLAGDARARALLPCLASTDAYRAEALANLAEGLGRRGDVAAARVALAESDALLGGLDGEPGTLAWCAVARARHALADAAAGDAALVAAEACARRERSNPTQPWPHLAVARAATVRLDALLAQLRAMPQTEQLSFDLEKAARLAVARANVFAALGDAAESERLHGLITGPRPPHPEPTLDGFAPVYRAVRARDPGAARALFEAHESAAQAAVGVDQAKRLGGLGLALVAAGETAYGEALLTQAATVIIAVPKSAGYTRGETVKQLGGRAADAGCWSPALTLLRKSTSKSEKQVIARPLSRCYARAGDFAGALAVIAMGEADPLHTAMACVDLIAAAAAMELPYNNYG